MRMKKYLHMVLTFILTFLFVIVLNTNVVEAAECPNGNHDYETEWSIDRYASYREVGIKSLHCKNCEATISDTVIPGVQYVNLNWDASDDSDMYYRHPYSGYTIEAPELLVQDSMLDDLVKGKDYTVSGLKDVKNVGVYTATVTFMGEYEGVYKLTYAVIPKPANSVKAKLSTKSGGYDDVALSWSKSTGASGYDVYCYLDGDEENGYQLLKSTTKTSYTKSNLKDGKKYYFKVVPYYKDSKGKKYYDFEEVNPVNITTLKKVSSLSVKKSGSKVKAKWSGISGESGYQVYKMTKSGSKYKKSSSYKTTSTSKTISAKKGKTYYYKVRAYKKYKVGSKYEYVYGPWSSVKKYKR